MLPDTPRHHSRLFYQISPKTCNTLNHFRISAHDIPCLRTRQIVKTLVIYICSNWHLECIKPLFNSGHTIHLVVERSINIPNAENSNLTIHRIATRFRSPINYYKDLHSIFRKISKIERITLICLVDKPPFVQALSSLKNVEIFILIEEGIGLYYNGKEKITIKKLTVITLQATLFFLFFRSLLRCEYKEQGKTLSGDQLLCRYPELLSQRTKNNFGSIQKFDLFYSKTLSVSSNNESLYFIGCDFSAIQLKNLEAKAIKLSLEYSQKRNWRLVYLPHPRTSEKELNRILPSSIYLDKLPNLPERSDRLRFCTLTSGAILDLYNVGHECYISPLTFNKRVIYSSLFLNLTKYRLNEIDESKQLLRLTLEPVERTKTLHNELLKLLSSK